MRDRSYAEKYIEEHGDEPWFKKILFIQDFLGHIISEMEKKNITQTALAESIGVHRSHISKVLHNDYKDKNITAETMIKLADAVGFEIDITLIEKSNNAPENNQHEKEIKIETTIADNWCGANTHFYLTEEKVA